MVEQYKGNKNGLLCGLIRRALGLPGGFSGRCAQPHKVSNHVSFIEIFPFSTERPCHAIQVSTGNGRPDETYSLGASAV